MSVVLTCRCGKNMVPVYTPQCGHSSCAVYVCLVCDGAASRQRPLPKEEKW